MASLGRTNDRPMRTIFKNKPTINMFRRVLKKDKYYCWLLR